MRCSQVRAEHNHSSREKRDSSMLDFTAIDEHRKVAGIHGVGRRAIVRSDGRKLDRYDWSLASSHRRHNRMYRALLAAAFGEVIGDVLS